MLLHLCTIPTNACALFLGPSTYTCPWSAEMFTAVVSQKSLHSPAQSFHFVVAHAALWLCLLRSVWEGRAGTAPSQACQFPASIKPQLIWSGN